MQLDSVKNPDSLGDQSIFGESTFRNQFKNSDSENYNPRVR